MQRLKDILIALLLVALLWVLNANAGNPAGPGTAPSSTSWYSIEDIYNRLNAGTAGSQSTFTEPSVPPGTGTMHTLNEVMDKAPAADNTNGAVPGEVLSGKTYWSLRTDGSGSSTWGVITGTLPTQTLADNTTSIKAGFYTTTTLESVDSDLVASNIKNGVDIFGVTGTVISATGTVTASYVLSGSTFSNATSAGLTGTMTNTGAVIYTPTTITQTVAAGYHNGEGKVKGDGDLAAANIKKDVEIFGVTGTFTTTIYPAAVPKTGQTTCYDASGNTVTCANTGQDGELQKGLDLPSPRFTDNSDGTVTDNLTGLIWLKNANCTETVGGVSGGANNWADALTFANNLASGNCGLSDGSSAGNWRLPNRFELESLINLGYFDPTLSNTAGTGKWTDGEPFTSVQSNRYWSSTTLSNGSSDGWYVDLDDGLVGSNGKTDSYYVWPVRGGQ